jgi:hypothetical protein
MLGYPQWEQTMKQTLRSTIVAGAVALSAGASQAGVITDTLSLNQLVTLTQAATYIHDLRPEWYPGIDILSATLTVTFMDDEQRNDGRETAVINPEPLAFNLSFHLLNTGNGATTSITRAFAGGSVEVARMEGDGYFTVNIYSNPIPFTTGFAGDFYVTGSTLTAQVPLPGALSLLGAGLVGLGIASRRRATR